jgi:hypothetical protein
MELNSSSKVTIRSGDKEIFIEMVQSEFPTSRTQEVGEKDGHVDLDVSYPTANTEKFVELFLRFTTRVGSSFKVIHPDGRVLTSSDYHTV